MNYKRSLEKLGLIENIDFAITAESFEMLPKMHTVEVTSAVLDEEGNILTPAVTEEQEYIPTPPSNDTVISAWNEVLIDENDVVELIEKFLSDKLELRDFDNDSMGISGNRIYSWSFTNITMPSLADLASLAEANKLEKAKKDRIAQKILIGSVTDKACNDAFMYIQGVNVERQLSSAQKTEMASIFAPALQAIQVKRPGQLKSYIQSITPDNILITEEIKEDLLEILSEF